MPDSSAIFGIDLPGKPDGFLLNSGWCVLLAPDHFPRTHRPNSRVSTLPGKPTSSPLGERGQVCRSKR